MTTPRNKLLAIGIALIALLFTVGAVVPPAVQAQSSDSNTSGERVAALVEPSIVYLDINLQYYVDATYSGLDYLGPYELTGNCTGFYVSSTGDVVTAAHCASVESGSDLWFAALDNMLVTELEAAVQAGEITEDDVAAVQQEAYNYWKVEGATPGSAPVLTITVLSALGVSGEQSATGKVARVIEAKKFEEGDVALLKVEGTNTPVLELGSGDDVSTGTEVMAVGFPQNEEVLDASVHPTFKDGQINNKGTLEGLKVPVYEMSATLSPGMSGGPTVGMDSKLIGVNSFSTGGGRDDFYFIAPVTLVNELLNRNGVKNELGKVDTLYREGINAYFDGDYQAAVDALQKVLDISPGHYKAQEYKQKAAEKAANAPPTTKADKSDTPAKSEKKDSGSSSMLFIILGVVVLLAIVAVVLIVVMKGKGKSGGPDTPTGAVPPVMPGQPGMAPPVQPGMPQPGAPQAPVPPAPTAAQPTAPPAYGDQPTVAYCAGCGNALTPGERFCGSCGKDQQSF